MEVVNIVAEVEKQTKCAGGRNPDWSRQHFEQPDTECKTACCKYCDEEFKDPRPCYLRRHLVTECTQIPEGVRKACIDKNVASGSQQPATKKKSSTSSVTGQGSLNSWVDRADKTTAATNRQANHLLIRWICCAGVAFNAIISPFFAQFCQALKPLYSVPGNVWLDAWRMTLNTHMHMHLHGTLQQGIRPICCSCSCRHLNNRWQTLDRRVCRRHAEGHH